MTSMTLYKPCISFSFSINTILFSSAYYHHIDKPGEGGGEGGDDAHRGLGGGRRGGGPPYLLKNNTVQAVARSAVLLNLPQHCQHEPQTCAGEKKTLL